MFGNAFAPIGLAFAVVYLGGSPLEFGLVLASGLVPQLLFLLVGGVVGDRLRRSRLWLWPIIVQFALVNAFGIGSVIVLGPFIAQDALGGAASWGVIMSAQGFGLLVGGVAMLKAKPARPLLVASLGMFCLALPPVTLALGLSTPVVAAAAFAAGAALE